MVRQRFASVVLAALLVAPTASAQEAPEPEPEIEEPRVELRSEGEYAGARPGQDGKAHAKRPRAGTLSWVGFGAEGGTGKIFLQAPNEFSYSQRVEGRTIVVHLEGLRRLGKNVARPLYTQHFDSPVQKITVKKVGARKAKKGRPARKAGVEVRIHLDRNVAPHEASARSALEADGYFYLYLDVTP